LVVQASEVRVGHDTANSLYMANSQILDGTAVGGGAEWSAPPIQ
jgi:hypothetical protein